MFQKKDDGCSELAALTRAPSSAPHICSFAFPFPNKPIQAVLQKLSVSAKLLRTEELAASGAFVRLSGTFPAKMRV